MNEEQPEIEPVALDAFKRPGIMTMLSIIEFIAAAMWVIISIACIIGMIYSRSKSNQVTMEFRRYNKSSQRA